MTQYLAERGLSGLKGMLIEENSRNSGVLGYRSDPIETSPLRLRVTTSNLVILHQKVYILVERNHQIGQHRVQNPYSWGVA